jgi:hypothetical protein
MTDTVSAALAGTPDSSGLLFLAHADMLPQSDPGTFHVAGAMQNLPGAPSLIVQFTTVTPDFQEQTPGLAPALSSANTQPSVFGSSDTDGSVIIEFRTYGSITGLGDLP